MSIISDALKKARESSEGRDRVPRTVPPPEPGPVQIRPEPAKSDGRWRFLAAVTLLLFATPFVVEFVSPPAPAPAEGGSASGGKRDLNRPGTPEAARAQFGVEERPVFFGSQRPSFSLSGIAQFQDSYMAVINGHILKQGDLVQGARVVSIRLDAVELEYKGERILLEKTF